MCKREKKLNEIPIVFAIDENYAPYLCVTLQSILDNASRKNFYNIYIFHHDLRQEDKNIIDNFQRTNCAINYIDVKSELSQLKGSFPLRDYFTKTTYYRLFAQTLCPQYDKILYLDSDIVVLTDIAKLYNYDITDYLVGAVEEDVMQNFDVFGSFVEKSLGIKRKKYFNAGVLVMNLKKFREEDILLKFYGMLKKYAFPVTQDQDYLNVLCKDKVLYIDSSWNRAPIPGTQLKKEELNLVHYKISWKPWKYRDVMYGEYFWHYACKIPYFDFLTETVNGYTEEKRKQDVISFNNLVELALKESDDENNYFNMITREAT